MKISDEITCKPD